MNHSWVFAALIAAFLAAAYGGNRLVMFAVLVVAAMVMVTDMIVVTESRRVRFESRPQVRVFDPASAVRPVDDVEKIIADCDKEVESNVFGKMVDWHSDIRMPQYQSMLTKPELDEYFQRAERDELLPLVDPQGPFKSWSIQAELAMVGPQGWFRDPMPVFQ